MTRLAVKVKFALAALFGKGDMLTSVPDSGEKHKWRQRHKALWAAGLGTFVEFFDYASYGYLATTIAQIFFHPGDRAAAILQTFLLFAASFAIRPIGGLFWGHFGDTLGRTRALGLTIIGMGLATTAIGCLPGYAAIGFVAPVLLCICRLLQGFCTAGEFSGAAVIAGEFAPPLKRGRYVSTVPISAAAGFLFASALVSLLHGSLSDEQMLAWGWRLPFFIGGALTVLTWYTRRSLEETPDFEAISEGNQVKEAPIRALFRDEIGSITKLLFIMAVECGGYYLVLTYMATYLEIDIGFSPFLAGLVTTVALIMYIPFLYGFAALSDWWGRRPVLLSSSILFILLSYPAFSLLENGGFWTALLVQILLVAVLALNDSTVGTLMIESVPAPVRFSGFALVFNGAVAIFAGTTPLLSTWLIQSTGNKLMPAFIIMTIAAMSLPALFLIRETAPARRGADAAKPRPRIL